MKTNLLRSHLFRMALAPCAAGLLLLAGCLEKNLVWSPDGSRAAVIGTEGLFLCDSDGKLSALLVPHVYRVAWLSDSQQLALARSSETGSWSELARVLGAEQAGVVAAQAESIWQHTAPGGLWNALTNDSRGKEHSKLLKINLCERYGEGLRARLNPGEWDDIRQQRAEVHELLMARIESGKILTGTQLYQGLGRVEEIRLAPGDRTVALVTALGLTANGEMEDGAQLMLAPVSGSGRTLVAAHVGVFPDWAPDGRSLTYVQASGGNAKDDLRLGTLVQREVIGAGGEISVKEEKKELAGWLFSDNSRIRCLRDGRILFNATEISLPIAAQDFGEPHEQLFAVDPARQATLVRLIPRKHDGKLPQALAFFEVSPDEKQVLFGSFDGAVSLLTVATGEVEQVQEAAAENLQGQPVWRNDGAFSYTRRTAKQNGPAPERKAEVVLRSQGKTTVLSAGWPDQMVNQLVADRN